MSDPGPLSRLFEAMEDALCVVEILGPDADGVVRRVRYLHANAAFERHTGVANAEGLSSDDAFPGLEQHWFDHFARVWRTGKPARIIDAAGSLGRVYEVSLSRIGTADTRHVACLFRDVTMQHAAQQRALQMAAELSEADRRKTEFLATLAHELRNPLAPIGNGLDLVEAIEGVPADAVRLHAMMSRQVGQLARLVDDLLDLSRISQDRDRAAARSGVAREHRRRRDHRLPPDARAQGPRARRRRAAGGRPGQRRSRAPDPGAVQPLEQRRALHAAERARRGARRGRRRGAAPRRRRRRRRHERGGPGAGLRDVHPDPRRHADGTRRARHRVDPLPAASSSCTAAG